MKELNNLIGKKFYEEQLTHYILISFGVLIALIWLDEIVDIPHRLLGAEATPINWRESLFESIFIVLLGIWISFATKKLIRNMKLLEGVLPICASCKKIRDSSGEWQKLELYISEKSEAGFTHSICEDCKQKLYPELYKK